MMLIVVMMTIMMMMMMMCGKIEGGIDRQIYRDIERQLRGGKEVLSEPKDKVRKTHRNVATQYLMCFIKPRKSTPVQVFEFRAR